MIGQNGIGLDESSIAPVKMDNLKAEVQDPLRSKPMKRVGSTSDLCKWPSWAIRM